MWWKIILSVIVLVCAYFVGLGLDCMDDQMGSFYKHKKK